MIVAAVRRVAMQTSVGEDTSSSAAAFRAGITRARELPGAEVMDHEETAIDSVVGHVAARRSPGAEGLGKMIALAIDPFRALAEAPESNLRERTGLYIVLPDLSRRGRGPSQVAAEGRSGPAALGSDDDETPAPGFTEQCRSHLLERLLRHSGRSLRPIVYHLDFGDHCSFSHAVAHAMSDLQAGAVQRCIVGAIDSYLDEKTLEWAAGTGKLKSESSPNGFAPGEAAVFVELVHPGAVSDTAGLISLPAFAVEAPGEAPPRGIGLSQAILAAAVGREAELGLVVSDQNGEVPRAMDWGHALTRLGSTLPVVTEAPLWYPAISFGETGCASAGLAIGVVLEGFRRGYLRSPAALIYSAADTGERSAFVLSRS